MGRHEFPQSFAALGAAIAVPMDLVTANENAEAGYVPIRLIAEACGGFHD